MATRADLVRQLSEIVRARLLDPLEILVGDDADAAAAVDFLERRVRAEAQRWAGRLLDDDTATATLTAARLTAALYSGPGSGDRPLDLPPEWWRTPLGQVVARRIGHPTASAVSYVVAGAMLGVTRQGVHDLVRRGKLARHPDGGVTSASVHARIQSHGQRATSADRT